MYHALYWTVPLDQTHNVFEYTWVPVLLFYFTWLFCFSLFTLEGSAEQATCSSTSSPGTRAMIEEIDANLPSAERKQKLLSALDQKIKNKGLFHFYKHYLTSFLSFPRPSVFHTFYVNMISEIFVTKTVIATDSLSTLRKILKGQTWHEWTSRIHTFL